MHRLIARVLAFSLLLCLFSLLSTRPTAAALMIGDTVQTTHAGSDSTAALLRSTHAAPDTLPAIPVDTVRIRPLPGVGSLTPISRPYTGLDADDIRWHEYRTATDLLSDAPGVFVRDMGSPGQDNEVTINGAEHSGTVFLVDGISQNDPSTGTYNFAFFPVEAIERMELVTGPRSFLYGTNAVGGAVNVISGNFSNNKPYTHIRYSQSDNSYTQTDAMFSQNILPRFNLSFGLAYLGYGTSLSLDQNRGRFPNADNEAYAFRTKLRYNVSHTVDLTFTHFYYDTQTSLNGGVDVTKTLQSGGNVYDENGATMVDLESYQKLFNHHAALTGMYRPRNDSALSVSASLYWSQNRREYRDDNNRLNLSGFGPLTNGVVIHDDYLSKVFGARMQGDWQLEGNLLSVLGETRSTRYDRSTYALAYTEGATSLSVKDEMSFGRLLTVAVYAKLEDVYFDETRDMGADATLRLSDLVTLSAGSSIASRRPMQPERYYAAGGADSIEQASLAASGLTPFPDGISILADEVHHVSEARISVSPSANLTLGLTATRRFIDHWIDDTQIRPVQEKNITIDNLAVSIRLRHGGLCFDGDATYTTHSPVLRGSMPIRLYPEWRGTGSLYFRGLLAKGNLDLKAGVRGMFVSAFDGEQVLRVEGIVTPLVNRPIGNAGTVDIFVVAHLGDAYIHVQWENLTNSAYMLTPFYPMYDRSVRIGVSWEFLD